MQKSQERYGVVVSKDVMVPMRDGLRLATDIYRPAREGEPLHCQLPAILERTPYDKSDAQPVRLDAEYFARRGYVAVIQDCRGRYASEGDFYYMRNEGRDGYDTVEWIAHQVWCNGKVGTCGNSYMAGVQNALAALDPPHLSAMVVNQGTWNGYKHGPRHGGAFELRYMGWAFSGATTSKEAAADPILAKGMSQVRFREWLGSTPIRRGRSPLALVPAYEDWFFDFLTHGDYREFWDQPGLNFELNVEQHADVPVLYIGGWYDCYSRSTVENFVHVSRHKHGPHKLVMGPWAHGVSSLGLTYAGDVDFGPEASLDGNLAPDYNALLLGWFDCWLKGIGTGIAEAPRVKIFIMGGSSGRRNAAGRLDHGGKWRTEAEWPLARTEYVRYYFGSEGCLRVTTPRAGEEPDRYLYDPADPLPMISGNIASMHEVVPLPEGLEGVPVKRRRRSVVQAGASHQEEGPDVFGCTPPYLPLTARQDVLVYQTPPIEHEIEVTGPITVELWASSSCVDTDFTAKLIDVHPPNYDYPEGYHMNLSDGIIRARYRSGSGESDLIRPDEVYRYEIVLDPVSNRFQVGHRIRIDISSSNFPRFDLNPNTGGPLGVPTKSVVAENTVFHDATRPSNVKLPIIPQGSKGSEHKNIWED